jgi:hypothetical protein
MIVLALGLFWASRTARQISTSTRQILPLITFSGGFTLVMLWLLVG